MIGVEQIRPLKIGLIAYNREQSQSAIKDFAKNNEEQIIFFSKDKIKLRDGTEIYVLHDNEYDLRGRKFDQLILCDDDRWDIIHQKGDFIARVLNNNVFYNSCVPYDYIVMKYEY